MSPFTVGFLEGVGFFTSFIAVAVVIAILFAIGVAIEDWVARKNMKPKDLHYGGKNE